MKSSKKRIVIFASGSGSNAAKIMSHFSNHPQGEIALVLSGNPKAGVLEHARKYQVPAKVLNREDFQSPGTLNAILDEQETDLLVLAGFLWLLPEDTTRKYRNRIVNIHPSLLPKYGGKGMYGNRVHQAVLDAGEKESGITIHLVDEVYDNGKVLKQVTCKVDPADDVKTLSAKIQALEHEHFVQVIESMLSGL